MGVNKIIIFSDTHLHANHPVVGEDFLNLGISALRQVREYAIENNEKHIVFLGDVFHLKDRIPVRVWNAFFEELSMWDELEIYSYFLMGNHDFHTHSSIEAFQISKFATPILDITELNIEGKRCVFIPYHKYNLCRSDIQLKGDILFVHDYFRGESKLTDTIYSNDENDLPISITDNFEYTFAGHAHSVQRLVEEVYHIGSPYQVSFNEVGQKKYFIHLTDEKLLWNEFTFPEFKIVDMGSDEDVNNCYVKLMYDCDVREAKVKKLSLLERGALGVKAVKINTAIVTKKERIKATNERDYMKEYINAVPKNDLDKELLYKIGLQLVEGI